MKTRKFLALALALIMAFAMIPVASLAENVDGLVNEAAAMRKLDNAWAALDAAEADALAQGMSRTEVINAVYTAALNLNTCLLYTSLPNTRMYSRNSPCSIIVSNSSVVL